MRFLRTLEANDQHAHPFGVRLWPSFGDPMDAEKRARTSG
jgi:hypothetical protein